ncbi:MAG: MFS transporter [Clostridia bacterium]|nr:MFS transporter [Clostridia bacterium]
MDNFFIKKYPAVKNKSFVRLLTSQLLSQSGGYIQNVALSALITEMTGSRMSLGIFLCVSYAPVFLFSYFAGRLTRKIPAKHMLIATEILLLAMSSALIFLSEMPFWGFLVFGALWGTVRAFQTPAATSMPKLMCDRDALPSGVAALSLAMSLSRAAGPIISGVLYTSLSYRAAFIANALSYIPSLFLLWGIKVNTHKADSTGKKGKMQLSIPLLAVVFAVSLVGTAYNLIFTGLSEKLALSRIWFSVFMALIGAGAVIGAYIMSGKKKFIWAALGIAGAAGVLAVSGSVFVICPVVLVYGLSDYLFFTSALTKIQEENNENSIAGAMGVYTIVTTGALPLGFLALGYLTQALPISSVLCIIAVCVAGTYLVFSRKIR